MMQGDSYGIPIEITKEDGTVVTSSDVSDVEITIGSIKKSMKKGSVSFSDGMFVFPITQSETFSLIPSAVKAQVRVVWSNGDVEGVDLGEIRVKESMSKEVLSK